MFHDRIAAGQLLATKLRKYQNAPGVILAVPRGGVPVAYPIAKELGFPLDVILTKKIGHPEHKEFAIGAASLSDYFVIPHPNVTPEYIKRELKAIRARLKEMHQKFMGEQKPEKLDGKTVVVIDDGMATGNTILATIQLLRKEKPAKIVVAVPVASKEAVQKLSSEADEVVTVLVPDDFFGVGAFYQNFDEVSDDEVRYYLEKLNRLKKAG